MNDGSESVLDAFDARTVDRDVLAHPAGDERNVLGRDLLQLAEDVLDAPPGRGCPAARATSALTSSLVYPFWKKPPSTMNGAR